MSRGARRVIRLLIALCVVGAVAYLAAGGRVLVEDAPQKSDVILVLEGETNGRPWQGIGLLRDQYAPRLLLDVQRDGYLYGIRRTEVARQFLDSLPEVDAARIQLCEIDAHSTRDEARAAEACLRAAGAHDVLIVTSDYHTRRALVIYRHELPGYRFSVAATRDPSQFGTPWWTHREWAKNFLIETVKLAWFQIVDRWT
jgi:uncharacterized SAM-binding protein YcdF (DUF218 family)